MESNLQLQLVKTLGIYIQLVETLGIYIYEPGSEFHLRS